MAFNLLAAIIYGVIAGLSVFYIVKHGPTLFPFITAGLSIVATIYFVGVSIGLAVKAEKV